MRVEVRLIPSDNAVLLPEYRGRRRLLLGVGLPVAVLFSIAVSEHQQGRLTSASATFLGALALGWTVVFWIGLRFDEAQAARSAGAPSPDAVIELTAGGLAITRGGTRETVTWDMVESVENTADHLVVRTTGAPLIIPKRCFPTPAAAEVFRGTLGSQVRQGNPGGRTT